MDVYEFDRLEKLRDKIREDENNVIYSKVYSYDYNGNLIYEEIQYKTIHTKGRGMHLMMHQVLEI